MPTAIPITEKEYSLTETVDATPEVLIVRFRPSDGAANNFEPGMFMMISGVDPDGKKYVGRAFSIASDPSSADMEFFIIKQHLHGDGSVVKSHFMESKIGDKFMLKGPNGQFRFDPKVDKKVMFIAGGTGFAPFMSMPRHIKLTTSNTDIITLYSIKYATEIISQEEIEQLTKDLKMKMVVTVTRPGQSASASQPSGASPSPKPPSPQTNTTTVITTTTVVTTTGTNPPQSTTRTTTVPPAAANQPPKASSLEPTAPKVAAPLDKVQSDAPMQQTKPPLQPAMVQPMNQNASPSADAAAQPQKPSAPTPPTAPAPATQQSGGPITMETGHIDSNMISKYCNDLQERTFYICGPLPFVQAAKTALASLGIPNDKVKADVWG